MVTLPLFFSLLVLFLTSSCIVQGRPEGAPKDACLTLNPDHSGIEAQKTPLPYDLLIDERRPYVDHKVTFTILSKSNDTKVGGFMVQARELEFISNPFGTFVPTNGSVRVFDCLGGYNNTATHIDSSPKDVVSMVWLPPSGYKGKFRFYATVAQTRDVFWVAVPSEIIEYIDRRPGVTNFEQRFHENFFSRIK